VRNRQVVALTSRAGKDNFDRGFDQISPVIIKQLRPEITDAILDGELIVWNKAKGVFEPFGGLRQVLNAARDGQGPGKPLVMEHHGSLEHAFDLPYSEDLEVRILLFGGRWLLIFVAGLGGMEDGGERAGGGCFECCDLTRSCWIDCSP